MLSTMLRVELVVLAVLALAVVIYAVNRRALQLKYSLLWMAIALALVVTACFPGTVVALTAWAGIETPSNLILFAGHCGTFRPLLLPVHHRVPAGGEAEADHPAAVAGPERMERTGQAP